MRLKDLVGIHSLTGVKRGRGLYHEKWCVIKEDTEFVAFRLDGVTYLAIEDPDDGYRSYCKELVVDNTIPLTEIPRTDVICVMKPDGEYFDNDILLVLDARTLACVLEVGTADTGDYYPFCVMSWHPENLYINRKEDLVKVVRCRECNYGSLNEYYGNVFCTIHGWARGPLYFCGDGGQREDEEHNAAD